MISVTRLDGTRIVVNADHIESIEETPDTVLSLANGHKILARERTDELVERIVTFRRRTWPERLRPISSSMAHAASQVVVR